MKGFHVQINARTEADLTEETVLGRLKSAAASHGSTAKRAAFQGAASEGASKTVQQAKEGVDFSKKTTTTQRMWTEPSESVDYTTFK